MIFSNRNIFIDLLQLISYTWEYHAQWLIQMWEFLCIINQIHTNLFDLVIAEGNFILSRKYKFLINVYAAPTK